MMLDQIWTSLQIMGKQFPDCRSRVSPGYPTIEDNNDYNEDFNINQDLTVAEICVPSQLIHVLGFHGKP